MERQKTVSTIMSLPQTRKQIELNHTLSYKIERKFNGLWNKFFNPTKEFTFRETDIITAALAVIAVIAVAGFVFR